MIEVVKDITPDLIFMDNVIPVIVVVRATQQLKAHTEFKAIHVIL